MSSLYGFRFGQLAIIETIIPPSDFFLLITLLLSTPLSNGSKLHSALPHAITFCITCAINPKYHSKPCYYKYKYQLCVRYGV